jgi:predicted ATPase/DNA-binding SARP family transcriptional activator
MSSLKIALFGAIQVELDRLPITLAYDKVRALLAFLLIEASNYPQRRETLAGLLWPEQSEKKARHSLSQALLKLRQAIDPDNSLIAADRYTVGWQTTDQIEWDTAVFTTTLHQCQTHQHAQPKLCGVCMVRRETAVSLYNGPFLAGLSLPDAPAFEQWQTQQREQFHRQVMEALDTLTTCFEQRGELPMAIQFAQRQLTLEPWREETHYQLMRLFLYNGQRSSAIAQYLTCVQTLADELGVEPSPNTNELYKLIQTAKATPPHNLPLETTPFVGRESEITQISGMLAGKNGRLITIVGPGGIGKSRLALAVAKKQLGRPTDEAVEANSYAFFTDGVYWVPLAQVTTNTGLASTIAEVIGLQLESGEGGFRPRSVQQQLVDYLQGKRILLVLDNFEQLLEQTELIASTQTIHNILQMAPHVYLLVTSRERLQLQGEQLFWLDGLTFPKTDEPALDTFTAVALFNQTAQRLQPQVGKDESDLALIAAICRFLEGSPLAIELAASTVNFLSLSNMLTSLQESLTLLTTSNRHIPERHRSMQAAFVTSWHRLSPELQEVLAKVSVFQNGFSFGAAQAVVQTAPQQLAGLIDHSLLRFDPTSKRYYFHELVRQYAAEEWTHFSNKVQTAVHARHATYYLQLFAKQETAIKGAKQFDALSLLEKEVENGRLAWRWASQHQPQALAPAIDSMALFFERLGRHQEGVEVCEIALEQLANIPSDNPHIQRIQGRLWAWNGRFLATQYQWKKCQHALVESARFLRPLANDLDNAFLQLQQSRFYWRGDREKAQHLAQQALTLAAHADNQWLMAEAHNLLGRMARAMSQFQSAQYHLTYSLKIRQSMQDQSGIAHTQSHLSLVLMDLGHLKQAKQYANKSLSKYQQINDLPNSANIHNSLGLIYLFSGQFKKATDYFEKSLAILDGIGLSSSSAMTQLWLDGATMLLKGNYETIFFDQLRIYGLFETQKVNRVFAYSNLGLAWVGIGAEYFAEASAYATQGIDLFGQLGQTKETAECSALKAIATQGEHRLVETQRHLQEYGPFLVESKTFFPTTLSMTLFILVELHQQNYEQAIKLHALLQGLPFVANGRWFADVLDQPIHEASKKLSPKLVAKVQNLGKKLEFWQTAVTLFRAGSP